MTHQLVEERRLVIGARSPEQGLSGHSDADVLLHASWCFAGAAGLGISADFPDNDQAYRGVSSLLLEQVRDAEPKQG